MPRRREPPRLWLKPAEAERGRAAVWVIIDGTRRESTGSGADDIERAQRRLADYIKAKFEAPTGLGGQLLISEVIAAYLKHHAANLSSPKSREFARDTAKPLLQWWTGKRIGQVNGINCRAYVKWRTSQSYRGRAISDQSARHDLKTLRAALNFYKRELDSSMIVPKVTLPSRSPPRTDYWLTREEVAARIRAARGSPRTKHVARMLLIGIYSGTRPGATLSLGWVPSACAGWFDLDARVLHRRGSGVREVRKRQPPVRIHARLLPHLRRWRAMDLADGITTVIHYMREPVTKLRHSWRSVASRAGDVRKDGPHILRHTAATWLMQAGVDAFEAAGFLGMHPETLWSTYGHHHPAFQSKAATATGKRSRETRTADGLRTD